MKTPTYIFTAILLIVAVSLAAQTVDSVKIKPSYHEVNDFVEDNESCLKCHANFRHFTMLTERPEINVVESHSNLNAS